MEINGGSDATCTSLGSVVSATKSVLSNPKDAASNIKIGYGVTSGGDSFAAGADLARQCLADLEAQTISAALIFTSVQYNLEQLLAGVRSLTGKVL